MSPGDTSIVREFPDNALAQVLFGPHNANLDRIEGHLGVALDVRGNTVTVSGTPDSAAEAARILDSLYQTTKRQGHLETADVDSAVRMVRHEDSAGDLVIRTRKRHIAARTPVQAAYIRAMGEAPLTFGLGPAGTGKTYLAVAKAVSMMVAGEVDRIILSRPAVEAGERLGFLPGDLKDKVDPYLRPLYDALHDMLPGDQVAKKLLGGEIEVAPLAFMRGRTLANSFIILDEAQNTTAMQMRMFLTRMGENSRMVVTGDVSQIDLPPGTRSGLVDAVHILDGVEGVRFVRFSDKDVVRHDLVTRIVRAYDKADRESKEKKAES
ncbi:Phosphate starvation-inducible protein PhoH predicted ATPase [Paramagnetospirillum magnetotacticum MS-1]|uniref:PhoH-like protein n=1 Tax=Paramagnetospirillum magnetotacticum MS-1 TaxID=272627 RepID=A0A0C2YE16_PARME|nr:PhoH family protein [Paramagnetospirillum magnetotacticum]KIL97949.1 Phosphate starvation-inducible protein PhoH predicted ATPase [Paramagnetospirillum magnetotacticum MS-1]